MKPVREQCEDFLSACATNIGQYGVSASMLEEFIDGIDYPVVPEEHPHYEVQVIGPDDLLLSLMIDGSWSTSIYDGPPFGPGEKLVIRRVK